MSLEGQRLDKKSLRVITGKNVDWPGLARDCVAFANARGGRLLIGIEDGEGLIQEVGSISKPVGHRAASAHAAESSILYSAKAHRQDQTPLAEMVNGQGLTGELPRMMPGCRDYQNAKGDALGGGRDRPEKSERIPGIHRPDADAVPGEVAIPAGLLGDLRQGDLLSNASVRSDDAIFHGAHLTRWV